MLDNTCMLVSLTIRSWTAEAKDRKVTREVAEQHGTDTRAGRYTKRLLSHAAIQEIQKIAGAARQSHYFMTLPWSNEGARILPAALFDEYATAMRDLRSRYHSQVDAFVANYPALVEQARVDLNGLFNADDYPSSEAVRERFAFSVGVNPVPTAQDFRVTLARADVDQIKAEIEQNTTAAIAEAMRDAWQRLIDVVGHMAARLPEYDGGKKGSFRDTLVDNVRDLVKILPKLNITGDQDMVRMVREIDRKLCRYDAEALRKDEAIRTSTADEAAAILARLQAFGG